MSPSPPAWIKWGAIVLIVLASSTLLSTVSQLPNQIPAPTIISIIGLVAVIAASVKILTNH